VDLGPGGRVSSNTAVKLSVGTDGTDGRRRAIRFANDSLAVSSPGVSMVGAASASCSVMRVTIAMMFTSC